MKVVTVLGVIFNLIAIMRIGAAINALHKFWAVDHAVMATYLNSAAIFTLAGTVLLIYSSVRKQQA